MCCWLTVNLQSQRCDIWDWQNPLSKSRIYSSLCFRLWWSECIFLSVYHLTSFLKIDHCNALFDLFLPLVGIDVRDEHKKYHPVTSVDISATRKYFCMKFYITVIKQNTYTLPTSFVKIYLKMTNYTNVSQRSQHNEKLAAREPSRVHWEERLTPTYNPDYQSRLGRRVKNYHTAAKVYDDWWVESRPRPAKSCHKNTSTRRWRTSPSASR